MSGPGLKIMLVAGEPSGDALGGQLMAGLKELHPQGLSFVGVGGPLMEAQGLTSLFPLSDTSVMGLREVVPRIPLILRRVDETAAFALAERPAAVVLIDSPDFTHRIARKLKRLAPMIPIIKYVAPQVWASRPWRARKLAEFVDHLLALLPFEPAFFEGYGVKTQFVGHPVIERVPEIQSEEVSALKLRLGIRSDAMVLSVLLGSRHNEVRFLLPVFSQVIKDLKAEFPDLVCLLPTVEHVRAKVAEGVKSWPVEAHIIDGERAKFIAFRASRAALACSGTVSTELALSGTPMVVAYRLGWLTALLARPFFRGKYITLANIILDRLVIPEYWQETATAENLANALRPLLASEAARRLQVREVREGLVQLGLGSTLPSRRAARAVLDIALVGKAPAALMSASRAEA